MLVVAQFILWLVEVFYPPMLVVFIYIGGLLSTDDQLYVK